jgi:dTDP-4-dehydrorhamnose 3,5-epimerase
MKFTETALAGAFLIDLQPHIDERGFFARAFCQNEFAAHGLEQPVAQCNLSHNIRRGTLRGMHWRAQPSPEAKLVRAVRGAIYDVIVDLRPGSPTYLKHTAVELSADNRRALFVPALFAHGFQTLCDDVEVFYQMSAFYEPGYDRGARWDDPAFGIDWPIAAPILNDRDRAYPDYPDDSGHAAHAD